MKGNPVDVRLSPVDKHINWLIYRAGDFEAAAQHSQKLGQAPRIARLWRDLMDQDREEIAALMWLRQDISEGEADHLAGLLIASSADRAYALMVESVARRGAARQAA